MTFIRRSEVPVYLQNGEFYEALEANDEEFEVPEGCVKPNTIIDSYEDLRHFLASLSFWGVSEVPGAVLRYVLKHGDIGQIDPLLAEFPEYEVYFNKIMRLKASEPTTTTRMAIELCLGVKVLRFLHEDMSFVLDPLCWIIAAQIDDVASMVYLQEQDVSKNTNNVVCAAAEHGSVEALMHAHTQGWEITDLAFGYAASKGHLVCVQFLHEVCGIFLAEHCMVTAARSGNLALIRYLLEKECPWHPQVCAEFARIGKLDCLIFAREQGCPWDESTCRCAAQNGHRQCLEHAHRHGCLWDVSTCRAAARGGHLSCLEFAHERGCPWDATTGLEAARECRFDCVTYACKHGCPVHREVCMFALQHGEWECAWCALRRGGINQNLTNTAMSTVLVIFVLYCKVYKVGRTQWPWALIVTFILAYISILVEFFEPLLTRHFLSAKHVDFVLNSVVRVTAVAFWGTIVGGIYAAVYSKVLF